MTEATKWTIFVSMILILLMMHSLFKHRERMKELDNEAILNSSMIIVQEQEKPWYKFN